MLGIINSRACNLGAYCNIADYLALNYRVVETAGDMKGCGRFILPGVGSFGAVMDGLMASGIAGALAIQVDAGKPILGICAGMQVLFSSSEESPGVKGLSLVDGKVLRLPRQESVSINIGWQQLGSNPEKYYFVHSYYCSPGQNLNYEATSSFGGHSFLGAFREGQISGLQFHPEKSGVNGVRLLKEMIDNMI